MKVEQMIIDTGSGRVYEGDFSYVKLSEFLTKQEIENFNTIGYTGKLHGKKTTYEKYLNSLGKGLFSVKLTRMDTGDFCESWSIVRVQQ